ncbi:MAG: hypothetical protein HY421_02205 [Candidatus Kerfeldbacteria bacterium]|nr:hypothetical protein [Candidatus Kerfeldbacteria bacterium]
MRFEGDPSRDHVPDAEKYADLGGEIERVLEEASEAGEPLSESELADRHERWMQGQNLDLGERLRQSSEAIKEFVVNHFPLILGASAEAATVVKNFLDSNLSLQGKIAETALATVAIGIVTAVAEWARRGGYPRLEHGKWVQPEA